MAKIPLSFRVVGLNQHCRSAVHLVQRADVGRALSGKRALNHPRLQKTTWLALHYECLQTITLVMLLDTENSLAAAVLYNGCPSLFSHTSSR